MNKVIKNIVVSILIFGMLVLLWFVMNNISSTKAKLLVAFIIATGIFIKLFLSKPLKHLRHNLSKIINHRRFLTIFFITIVLLGIILRFSFYFIYSYAPLSDPASFFNHAQSIASGAGLAGNAYVAFFPYLAAYDNMLGFAIKIVGNPWLATIVLNTIFDISTAIIALLLVKKISVANSKKPLIVFALWLLSPFNIIFSVLSLPIIVVNFFIILTIYLIYILTQKVMLGKTAPSLLLSLLIGLTMGYGNCFRPIFIVVIIATILYLAYIVVTNKNSRKVLMLAVSSLVIIIATFLCIQRLNVAFVSYQTGIQSTANAGGWSIYVGSNTKATGSWNVEDDTYLYDILKNDSNFERVHKRLTNEGIERYKSYGIAGTLNLMIRKLSLFSGSQASVYDAEASIIGYQGSIVA